MNRVETYKVSRYVILGIAVLLDRFLKTLVEQPAFLNTQFGFKYFGFEQFHNFGIAFGIPIPLPLVIVISIGFIVWLFFITKKLPTLHFWFITIAIGAISNLTDRIVYGYTIDYLRIINSIINIADLLVIIGVFMLLRTKNLK